MAAPNKAGKAGLCLLKKQNVVKFLLVLVVSCSYSGFTSQQVKLGMRTTVKGEAMQETVTTRIPQGEAKEDVFLTGAERKDNIAMKLFLAAQQETRSESEASERV
jgi:hypothetical protein